MHCSALLTRSLAASAAVALSLLLTGSGAAADVSSYEKLLKEKGIEPTPAAMSDYLRQLHPSEDQRKISADLITQLGSDVFAEREKAMQKLLIMPVIDTQMLVAAGETPDPEVRWRARKILAVGKPETERVLFGTFKIIEEKKNFETIPALIAAIPLCEKPHLRQAAHTALVAAARPEDAAQLTPALENANQFVRAAATAALGQALGKEADEQLVKMSADESEAVRLAAAQAMANYGQRKALDVLIALLESEDVTVRTHSSVTLSSFTQKFFGYAAYDTPERRAASVTQWKDWLKGEGQSATLQFPLKPFGYGISYLNGNTLLAFGNRNRVAELDPSGKEIWSYDIVGAWSAEKLANGNVLIASNSMSKVVEVDRDKKVVWEYGTPNPLNAKPLPNGNVLVAGFTQRKVLEVNREKATVWEYDAGAYVADAHRLENGNTLIACMNGPIREITPDKKVVWEFGGARQAYGCQPLPNGNVLIANLAGEVQEVNREGKVVWEHREQNPCDVCRLPNGNTLITGAQRFVEITPDKKEVWKLDGCQYGSARR